MVEWFCIIGLFQHKISFIYALVIGGVKRKSYIQMMEQEADLAQQAGRLRIIVQSGQSYTSMPRSPTVVVKVGKPGFVHLVSAQILLSNEPN